MINSFLNPDKPYKKAEEASNAAWQEAQGYEKPFWQQGLDQYGRLTGAENALLDPTGLQAKWNEAYQMSPEAKYMLEQSKNQGLDAASSMGLLGSSAAIENIQRNAGNITAADRDKFLNDLMQKYMAGIGIGQNIYGVGANMGANLASGAMQHGQDVAGLEYGRAAAPGAMFGKLAGMGIGAGLNYATGGLSGMTGAFNNWASPKNSSYTG